MRYPCFLIFLSILVSQFLFVNSAAVEAAEAKEKRIVDYYQYFYNRYSRNFDKYGLIFSIPDYGLKKFGHPQTAREIFSLASYYKYRALSGEIKAQQILRKAIRDSLDEFESRSKKSLSFNDAEAFFLMTRISDELPDLLAPGEKERLFSAIKKNINEGILAKDTENRALVAGAHWQYLVNYLFEKNFLSQNQKTEHDNLIKEKIDQTIKISISPAGWYREMENIVPHYQAVSAYMLLLYGELTNQSEYKILAEKMYFNLKRIAFANGQVEAQIGHRPIGLGAQFYLILGLLGKEMSDADYAVFLSYADNNRFFSDKKHPHRLEFHRTSLPYYQTKVPSPNYHDDYAFSDIAELSVIQSGLKKTDTFIYKNKMSKIEKKTTDGEVNIENLGQKIIIQDLKNKMKITLKLDNSGKVRLLKKKKN